MTRKSRYEGSESSLSSIIITVTEAERSGAERTVRGTGLSSSSFLVPSFTPSSRYEEGIEVVMEIKVETQSLPTSLRRPLHALMIRQAPAGGEGVRRRLARAKGQRMSEGETERQNLYHVMEEVGPETIVRGGETNPSHVRETKGERRERMTCLSSL